MTTPRNQTPQPLVFGNAAGDAKKEDRRVRRTRDRLGDALIALLQQKPFDDITVQEVLDRAAVSRATFYTHYRDKNDLFLSDADEFFESMAFALSRHRDRSERLAPVQELFAHIAQMRTLYEALVEAGRLHDIMELGQAHFARGIEGRLGEIPRAHNITADRRGAVAHGLSGTLFSLLTWWIQHGAKPAPQEMDELFHKMAWAGASAAV